MKTLGIICMIVAVIILVVAIICSNDSNSAFAGWFAGLIFTFGISSFFEDEKITPMDVYQGKTILEYKVKDGVVVDSTVVWKNK